MAVVEVLPWAPVMATWVWFSISSANNLAPAQHGEALGPGRGQLGVVLFHRGGVDHDVGVPQVFGPVALIERAPPGSPGGR